MNPTDPSVVLTVFLWVFLWGSIPILRYANSSWRIPHFKSVLTGIGLVQLCVGIVLARQYYTHATVLFSFQGWYFALALAVGLELIQFAIVKPKRHLKHSWWKTVYKALYFIILIGFAEELWFRGIWFAMFKNRMIWSVIVGSIMFGIIHYGPGRGLTVGLITLSTGLSFAVARSCGASILTLAVAHGVLDFLNTHLIPAAELRVSKRYVLPIFLGSVAVLVTILFIIARLLPIGNTHSGAY